MLYATICFQDRGVLSDTIVLRGNSPEQEWSCLLLIPRNTKCIQGDKTEPVGPFHEERPCWDSWWIIPPWVWFWLFWKRTGWRLTLQGWKTSWCKPGTALFLEQLKANPSLGLLPFPINRAVSSGIRGLWLTDTPNVNSTSLFYDSYRKGKDQCIMRS